MPSGTFLPPGITTSNVKISTGGSDNQVLTAVDGETAQGEPNLTFDGTDLVIASGSLQVRTIDYSDGDNAMTIADGGAVTFAQATTISKAAANGDIYLHINNSDGVSDVDSSASIFLSATGTNTNNAALIQSDFTGSADTNHAQSLLFYPVGVSSARPSDPALKINHDSSVVINGAFEANAGAVFNEGSADADFRIESNGATHSFMLNGGTGHIGLGATDHDSIHVGIAGTAAAGSAAGLQIYNTIDPGGNSSAASLWVGGGNTIVEHSSGTHPIFASAYFQKPTITGGSATLANAATVYIAEATDGTVTGGNYALWVDDGVSRFDGDVGIGETSPDTVLHIKDAAPDITLEDSDGGDVYKIGNNGGNYRIRNVTDSRTDLNIEGGGHVGIGTTSASSYHNFADDLVVYSTSQTGITVATNDTSSGRGALYFNDTAHGVNNPQGYITYTHSNDYMYIGTNSNGSASFYLDDNQNVIFARTVFINETANANMSTGLTINQGAADDQILAFKSSDVNHGLTSYASVNTEIDDFAVFSKMTAGTNGGGLRINAIAEDHSSNSEVFQVWASGGQAATGQTVTGTGLIDFVAMEHNGSNARAAITADGNVFTVRAYMDDGGGVGFHTRFLVDEDGDLFADGTLSAYDTFEDAHLVRALDIARGSKDVIKNEWDNFLKYGEEKLVELGILGDTVENGGLVNVTGLQRLHNGAIWQGYTRQMEQEERIKELETRLLALEGGK
tara:strand:- start:846 stop:3050 length:2205 start_codon:yes stop_codon:yes gene_type:complete